MAIQETLKNIGNATSIKKKINGNARNFNNLLEMQNKI